MPPVHGESHVTYLLFDGGGKNFALKVANLTTVRLLPFLSLPGITLNVLGCDQSSVTNSAPLIGPITDAELHDIM